MEHVLKRGAKQEITFMNSEDAEVRNGINSIGKKISESHRVCQKQSQTGSMN
jgi:hypothetical protein